MSGTGIYINESVSAPINAQDPNKSSLMFARRKTDGVIRPTLNGDNIPNYYIPFQLASYTDPVQAVTFLKDLGLRLDWGTTVNRQFKSPNFIINNPSNPTQKIISWNYVPSGFSDISNIAFVGSVTQGASSAKYVQSSVLNGQAFMVITNISGTFVSGVDITITGINNIRKPNPETSDEAVTSTFAAYNQLSILPPSSTTPNLWLSLLPDDATDVAASATPISLVAPTSVLVNPDSSVDITYPALTVGLGYLPTTYFGSSEVKSTSASGTYNGYTYNSGTATVVINVIDVTGTFIATESITVTLEPLSAFNYLGKNEINIFGLPFEVKNLLDLQTKYIAFYTGINTLSSGININTNKFFPMGYFANLTSKSYALGSVESQFYKGIWKSDVPTFIDYKESCATVVAANLFLNANQSVPYKQQAGTALNLSASSNPATYPSDIDLNTCYSNGWTGLQITSSSVTIYKDVNQLTTINGNESPFYYRDMHTNLVQRYIWRQVKLLWDNSNRSPDGQAVLTPSFIKTFRDNIISILISAEDQGMLVLVDSYLSAISVIQSPQDINTLLIFIPNEPSASLMNARANILLLPPIALPLSI